MIPVMATGFGVRKGVMPKKQQQPPPPKKKQQQNNKNKNPNPLPDTVHLSFTQISGKHEEGC